MPATRTPRSRLGEWFGFDSTWVRPNPPISRSDVLFGAAMEAFSLLALELARSAGIVQKGSVPTWLLWLVVSSGAVILIGRRRFPLAVALLAAAHFFVVGVTLPGVALLFPLQVSYFIAFFSAMSWGRSRRGAVLVVGAIVVFMLLWVAWQFALGSSIEEYLRQTRDLERDGPFGPVTAYVLYSFLTNIAYFLGALIGGQAAWRAARQKDRLLAAAATIEAQADDLRVRAVTEERMRIARELHDVVGHHVSVIGIQAAAARRVATADPAATQEALTGIEESSREAVTQMRALLGTLRSMERTTGPDTRAPEPGVSDLAALAAERSAHGLETAYDLVESTVGAAAELPRAVGLTLYRIGQEALSNVERHSTARAARMSVRVESGAYAEIEVVDDGRPRPGAVGSGLGQLGIRERAASHNGTVEIGPRPLGGYRVRVRIPLQRTGDPGDG